jgi:antitoxin Phd
MVTVTSVEARRRFGELIDCSQRELVAVTRHGRTVAYIVAKPDLQALSDVKQRRAAAARWYSNYCANAAANALTDDNANELAHEWR